MSGAGIGTRTVEGLDHVAVTVSDMDRALTFYRDLLGCEELGQLVLDDGTFKLVFLRAGTGYVELFAHRPPAAPAGAPAAAPAVGIQHIAFKTADVDAVAARLAAAGAALMEVPRNAPGGVRLAFLHDPDGNVVELVSNLPRLEAYRPGWD